MTDDRIVDRSIANINPREREREERFLALVFDLILHLLYPLHHQSITSSYGLWPMIWIIEALQHSSEGEILGAGLRSMADDILHLLHPPSINHHIIIRLVTDDLTIVHHCPKLIWKILAAGLRSMADCIASLIPPSPSILLSYGLWPTIES
jgi:hypothetical protein